MSLLNKRLFYRIGLYSVASLIAYGIYLKANVPPESDEAYAKRTGRVIIHDRFFKYDVYEHDEMKPISDMLTKGCNGDKFCEIDRTYQYVLKIPYKESDKNQTPAEVINNNGGDCDEKSYLLATLLLQQGHPCIFIVTKDHGFLAVHLEDDKQVQQPNSYVLYDGKKYYLAETTFIKSYLGKDNNTNPKTIDGVLDMMSKKEIPMDKVEFMFTLDPNVKRL